MALNEQALQLVVVAFLFWPLGVIAMALRIYSRRIQGVRLGWNDYLLVGALVFAASEVGLTTGGVFVGAVGHHTSELIVKNPGALLTYAKLAIPGQIVWAGANTCVKLSILILYTKLFPSKKFAMWCYAAMVLTFLYCVSVILSAFLLCTPVQFNWDKSIPNGHCVDQTLAYLVSGATNLVLDAFIVILPMPQLYGLQMPLPKRIAVAAMFSLGAFICIISLLRIIAVANWDLQDPTYTGWGTAIYSVLEPVLGVINACLPVIRPAIRALTGDSGSTLMNWTRKSKNDSRVTRGTNAKTYDDVTKNSTFIHEFERLDDNIPLTQSTASTSKPSSHKETNNITVKREWNVKEQTNNSQSPTTPGRGDGESQEYFYANHV